ncbi:hypothetical protein Bca101_088766 [Brassica carinata]
MSEQENHSGRWISTSAASETKAPHSSDYAHYPRLNPSDITPPMHAPISGATATIFCLSSSLTVLLSLPPRVSYLTFLSLKCRNGSPMSTHCMVIHGAWSSGDGGWNFVIDKDKMSRIFPVHPGMSLSKLESNVIKKFFAATETAAPLVLSYWPPNTKELVTGLTTPPIIMTNDGALVYFFLHLEAHCGMNLFVTFQTKAVTQQPSQVDENPLPFTTQNQPIKHNLNHFRPLLQPPPKSPHSPFLEKTTFYTICLLTILLMPTTPYILPVLFPLPL